MSERVETLLQAFMRGETRLLQANADDRARMADINAAYEVRLKHLESDFRNEVAAVHALWEAEWNAAITERQAAFDAMKGGPVQ